MSGGGCVPCNSTHKTAEVYDPRSLPNWTGAQNNMGMRAIGSVSVQVIPQFIGLAFKLSSTPTFK
jgi:hypothetical protein